MEFVEELSMYFGVFDDNNQISLQGDILAAGLTILDVRIGCCQGHDACFVFPSVMRRDSDLPSAWYTLRVNKLGFRKNC